MHVCVCKTKTRMYFCRRILIFLFFKEYQSLYKCIDLGPTKKLPLCTLTKSWLPNALDQQTVSIQVLAEKVVGGKEVRKVYTTSLQLANLNYFSSLTVASFSARPFSLRCGCVLFPRPWTSSLWLFKYVPPSSGAAMAQYRQLRVLKAELKPLSRAGQFRHVLNSPEESFTD